METINKEVLLSSLFAIGFNIVDEILYYSVLDKIYQKNLLEPLFRFDSNSNSLSVNFREYVTILPSAYKIDDAKLIVEVLPREYRSISVSEVLNVNEKLVEFLRSLDYEELFKKKLDYYIEEFGEDETLSKFSEIFSTKEIEIMRNMKQVDYMRIPHKNDFDDEDK